MNAGRGVGILFFLRGFVGAQQWQSIAAFGVTGGIWAALKLVSSAKERADAVARARREEINEQRGARDA